MPWLTGTAFPAFGDHAGKSAGMMRVVERLAGFPHLHALHLGNFVDAQRGREFRVSCLRGNRKLATGSGASSLIIVLVCLAAYFKNRDYLRSDNQLDSMLSRESSFLFNNLILLVACVAGSGQGRSFRCFSEAVRGSKISVGPSFFSNRVNIPIAMFPVVSDGRRPRLLAWRKNIRGKPEEEFRFSLDRRIRGGCHRRRIGVCGKFYVTPLHPALRVCDADDSF